MSLLGNVTEPVVDEVQRFVVSFFQMLGTVFSFATDVNNDVLADFTSAANSAGLIR